MRDQSMLDSSQGHQCMGCHYCHGYSNTHTHKKTASWRAECFSHSETSFANWRKVLLQIWHIPCGLKRKNLHNVLESALNLALECQEISLSLSLVFQLLSESQSNMMKVVNTLSDVFDSMQKEPGSMKVFLKADLQRAPVRSGIRSRGCSSGEGKDSCC